MVRCAQCGTAIWSHFASFGEHGAGVRAGTLDDPYSIKPDAIIYAAERMPWVALPEDIPAFDGYYKPSEVLPADRFGRAKALAAKAAS